MPKNKKRRLSDLQMRSVNEKGSYSNLNQKGYGGSLSSAEAGAIGGQTVRKIIEAYENKAKP